MMELRLVSPFNPQKIPSRLWRNCRTSFVFLWKNLISYVDDVGMPLCFCSSFFCVLHCIFTFHALEVLDIKESVTCDTFCRQSICSVNAIHRLETTRHWGSRGLKSVWFCLYWRCSSALKHFAPALYFIPAIVTFSKQKQTPLYKISKKACRHSSARHLMGINYACFFCCCCFFPGVRRHKALFKINTASGSLCREVGNDELQPSLPDQRPRPEPPRLCCYSRVCFCIPGITDQQRQPEFGCTVKGLTKPLGRSLTLGAALQSHHRGAEEACKVILIIDTSWVEH